MGFFKYYGTNFDSSKLYIDLRDNSDNTCFR